jgi:putative tryptophan/tyrosine transport system substrate-binding protein
MRTCELSSRGWVLLLLVAATAVMAAMLVRAAEPSQRVVRVGFVSPLSPSTISDEAGLSERLHELGWVEGQNLILEKWSAEGQLKRLPALMSEAIAHKVDVLVTYGAPAAAAAKYATSTIPIVVAVIPDLVRTGLVASQARPGGNLTGLSMGYGEGLGGKLLELLQEVVPRLSTVAVIMNPDNPYPRDLTKDLEAFAPKRALKLHIIELRGTEAIEHAFEQARRTAQAAVVIGEPFTLEHRKQVTAFAAKRRLPAIYTTRYYVDVGGLITYGPDLRVMFRRAAEYVDKILRGAKPADLPIEQPTQYLLIVNLKTAKALGITVPESILLRANEVIR